MSSGRRKRMLTSDEIALWSHVTRQITPLSGRVSEPEPEPEIVPPAPLQAPPLPSPKVKEAKQSRPAIAPQPSLPPLAPLERRLRQRLSRGDHPVDAVIDLHGMRQDEAHTALIRFIRSAQAQRFSVVLVVTGKGGSGPVTDGRYEERGILRRMVPHWLRMPEMRGCIIGFETAERHHGGEGALYVRIRRPKGSAA
jgi:DNA-nicking Smr family endonuclease